MPSHKVHSPLVESVVDLNDHSLEGPFGRVQVPEGSGVEVISKEPCSGDEISMRIIKGVHILQREWDQESSSWEETGVRQGAEPVI